MPPIAAAASNQTRPQTAPRAWALEVTQNLTFGLVFGPPLLALTALWLLFRWDDRRAQRAGVAAPIAAPRHRTPRAERPAPVGLETASDRLPMVT